MSVLIQLSLLRIWHIVGDPKATPPIPPLIPVSKTTWWDGVKSGRFPKSIKLGPRTTVWTSESIKQYLEKNQGQINE